MKFCSIFSDIFLIRSVNPFESPESQRRSGTSSRRKIEDDDWEGEQGHNGFSASEDDTLAP